MKIAMVCTEKLPVPPVAGGAVQLYIDGILPYLSKDHDITVFSIRHPLLPNEETTPNARYIRISAPNKAAYLKGVKEKLDDSFDLVQVFNRPKWIPQLSENLPGVKFSLSLHNEMFLPEKIPEAMALKSIERVTFINTVSRFIANGVKNLYPCAENKLNVVYSGVDTDIYFPNWTKEGALNKALLRKKYNIESKKVVLHVTRISPKKGTHIVLKAMKKVMDENKDVALVIIGSKWYGKNEEDDFTKECRLLAKDLKGQVVFTGFIPPAQIPSYYNLGDIFLCASQWNEPLARIHYEAMAAGLPIITTDRGGNGEIIEENINGIAIKDYNNPDKFAEHINYYLENPQEAISIGKNSRDLALQKYTWQRVASEVLTKLS